MKLYHRNNNNTRVVPLKVNSISEVRGLEDALNDKVNSFQYSTSEAVNTGNKWIDGKDIWVQVVNFGALPSGDKDTPVSKDVDVPNTILSVRDTTIDVHGIALHSGGYFCPLPHAWSESPTTKPMITLQGVDDGEKIRIRTQYDYSSFIAYVYIFFTKTS